MPVTGAKSPGRKRFFGALDCTLPQFLLQRRNQELRPDICQMMKNGGTTLLRCRNPQVIVNQGDHVNFLIPAAHLRSTLVYNSLRFVTGGPEWQPHPETRLRPRNPGIRSAQWELRVISLEILFS